MGKDVSMVELASKLDSLTIDSETGDSPQGIPRDVRIQCKALKSIRKTMMSTTQSYQRFPKGKLCSFTAQTWFVRSIIMEKLQSRRPSSSQNPKLICTDHRNPKIFRIFIILLNTRMNSVWMCCLSIPADRPGFLETVPIFDFQN